MARTSVERGAANESGAAGYRWEYAAGGAARRDLTAEQWLRCVWEDAPSVLRVFLRVGWRFGLGLRLGPADPSHVLGWHIDSSTDTTVVVSASSRIVSASNTLIVEGDSICWQTVVRPEQVLGRIVWAAAALVHQRIVPWSVRRAIRSID